MDKMCLANKLIEEIYESLYDELYIYAKNIIKDPLLAEEAIQDTFCIACAKRSQIFSSTNPKGWVVNTLKNVLRNMIRTQRRMSKIFVQLLTSGEIGQIYTNIDWNVDILYEDIAENSDFKLLKMISLDKYSIKEVAEKLGISVPACKKRIQRARNYLRQQLYPGGNRA